MVEGFGALLALLKGKQKAPKNLATEIITRRDIVVDLASVKLGLFNEKFSPSVVGFNEMTGLTLN